jgi:hypothetical protein
MPLRLSSINKLSAKLIEYKLGVFSQKLRYLFFSGLLLTPIWARLSAVLYVTAQRITDMSDIYTVSEYCKAEKISRGKLYAEWKRGDGVAFFKRGKKAYVTEAARLAYREKLLKQTAEGRVK